jgi:hypothetical protein
VLALIAAASFLVDQGDPLCPAAALEGAVRARVPSVQVGGAPSGGDDLRASLFPDETGFSLEVRRAGEVALRRELRIEECQLAVDTAALVIDRFLDEIHWSGKPATIEPLPAPPPVVAPLPQRRPRFEFGAGPVLWLGAPDDVRAGALIAATVRLEDPFEASFLALGSASSAASLPASGAIDLRQAVLALSAAACAEPGIFRLCAGPLLGARASLGSATGVRQAGSAVIWQPEAGLQARAAVRLGAGFLLGIQLLGSVIPGSATFTVSGSDARRTLSKVDAMASMSLAFQAF